MNQYTKIKTAILNWYFENQRDLPWRGLTDPYAIWISEIMLQQTRVETVRPYFQDFLDRFSDLHSLAEASDEEVRAAWSGLGYYRRAKLMHQAAKFLVKEREGIWPRTASELQQLPGFGRYTSGAVASIAFNEHAAAVDGNVQRVLARLDGIRDDVTKGSGQKSIWQIADNLASEKLGPDFPFRAGDWTQSLIELGALVCKAKSPLCQSCPVRDECVAAKKDWQSEIPPPKKRTVRKSVHFTAIVLIKGRSVAMVQRPAKGIFADLWCLPLLEGKIEADAVHDEIERIWQWSVDKATNLGGLKHVLTHRDVYIDLVRVYSSDPVPASFRQIKLDELSSFGIPSVTSKLLKQSLPSELLNNIRLPGRRTVKSSKKSDSQTEMFED
ncbi:MAG: A/G-specific adenine glycosylase [Myxococcota bacterium]|nr:A/G-specific adenine glycosylase [Myxococcota bacterium]